MFNILSHKRNANQNNSEIAFYTYKNGQGQKHWWQLMLEKLWGKGNTSPLLAGSAPLDIRMVISQKIRKQPSSRPSYTVLKHTPKLWSIIQQGHLINYVHNNFICNSQNLETTYMFFNWGMDLENVVLLHNGVLLKC